MQSPLPTPSHNILLAAAPKGISALPKERFACSERGWQSTWQTHVLDFLRLAHLLILGFHCPMRTLGTIRPRGLMLWFVQCGHRGEEDTLPSHPFSSLVGLRGRPGQRGGDIGNPECSLVRRGRGCRVWVSQLRRSPLGSWVPINQPCMRNRQLQRPKAPSRGAPLHGK